MLEAARSQQAKRLQEKYAKEEPEELHPLQAGFKGL